MEMVGPLCRPAQVGCLVDIAALNIFTLPLSFYSFPLLKFSSSKTDAI